MPSNARSWTDWLHGPRDAETLHAMLHPDAVFHSPVVHTPQRGRDITQTYLLAFGEIMGDDFAYARILDCGPRAILEFEMTLDGIHVNGVDIIEWDEAGRITDFKVMLRPLKAIQAVHAAMAARLSGAKPA